MVFETIKNLFWRSTSKDEAQEVRNLLGLSPTTSPTDEKSPFVTNNVDPQPQQVSTSNSSSIVAPAASRMGRPLPAALKSIPKEQRIQGEPNAVDQGAETKESQGVVTIMEDGVPRGIIDGRYFFDKNTIGKGFKRGDKIIYTAEKPSGSSHWSVTSMKLYVSPEEEEKLNRRRFATMIGIVDGIERENRVVKFKYGRNYMDVQDLPFSTLPKNYTVVVGDYLRAQFEINSLDENCDTGKVVFVEPSKMKTVIGIVTSQNGRLAIDNVIYFDRSVCKNGAFFRPHKSVKCVAVESSRDGFSWRAISVEASNFRKFMEPPKQEDGWMDTENIWSNPLSNLLEDKNGLKINPKVSINFGGLKIGSLLVKEITIENSSARQAELRSVVIKGDQSACKFEVELNHVEAEDIIGIIGPGQSYQLKIKCSPKMLGSTRELCVFHFDSFKIGRYLVITGLSDQEEIMEGIRKPINPNSEFHQKTHAGTNQIFDKIIEDNKRTVIPATPLLRTAFFLPKRLPSNPVPRFLWEVVKLEDEDRLLHAYPHIREKLSFKNYIQKFQVSLWLEEIDNQILRRQYDMDSVVMRKSGMNLAFEVPGIKDIHPPLYQGDLIKVIDSADPNGYVHQGNIAEIHSLEVHVRFPEDFVRRYDKTTVSVQFLISRTTHLRSHFAIEMGHEYLGESWLFPTEDMELKPPRIPFIEDDDTLEELDNPVENQNESLSLFEPRSRGQPPTDRFFSSRNADRRASSIMRFESDTRGPAPNASIESLRLKWVNAKLNPEQRNAVRRILRGQGRPLPYVIFGPPGTGKTVTVVEAIIQVYKLDKNSRILVCAPSNAAADIIAQHLVNSKLFLPGDFVRLVGFLRQEFQIPEDIRDYCVDGDKLDTVARNRVIITTCTSAGQFYSLGIESGHFTHVFIDEAGYCTEPEAIIAASLVAVSKAGQVILAGDPQQLGPVLMSRTAGNCGLSLSLLERIMGLPLYSRNETKFPTEKYNPVVLTKLVKNYRAHPTLLKLPSALFYDDELESAAAESEINLCHSLDFLPAKGVPLLFHGLNGKTSRERDSPSWYNAAEVIQVVEYVRKLKNQHLENSEIGIITPYRKQVEKIKRALELGLLQEDIPKVGSVEEFQGGERKVMIMSLVRSAPEEDMNKVVDRMSFVYSAKRFNVAITRAKAALIVIGNPHLLSFDKNWVKFLKYCLELGCYTGCNLPLSLNSHAQRYLSTMESTENRSTPKTTYDSDGEVVEESEEEDADDNE